MDSDKCLLCDLPQKSRGLCATHYTQYTRALAAVPIEKKKDFEQRCISAGKLNAKKSPGGKDNSEFADLLAEFADPTLAEHTSSKDRPKDAAKELAKKIAAADAELKPGKSDAGQVEPKPKRKKKQG